MQSLRPILFALTILIANDSQGQSELPHRDAAASWKTAQLAKLDRQLELKSLEESLREEVEARRLWLENWTAGKMASSPGEYSQPFEIRSEPILKTDFSMELRTKLLTETPSTDQSDWLILKQAIKQHPQDVGLQQLQLHWMDLPIRRKTFLDEIDDSALRLLNSLRAKTIVPQNKLAIEFTLYRRARALAYRELPDVVKENPIENPEQLNVQIVRAFDDLIESSGKGRPEFILLEIRILRRASRYGKALSLLEKYGAVIKRQWYLKKRRDLLKELEWELPFAEAAKIYAIEFPAEVAKENSQ